MWFHYSYACDLKGQFMNWPFKDYLDILFASERIVFFWPERCSAFAVFEAYP